MPVHMFDCTSLDQIPADAPAVAGYVGGSWPTYHRIVELFPRAYHLSIAVDAEEDAECLDIECGDAVAADAPAWVRRQLARGVHRPVLYSSVSNMRLVLSALQSGGISRTSVRLWAAHYTGERHLCTPDGCGYALSASVDATQWTDHALGLKLDESVCADSFFGPPPPPPDPNHYHCYSRGPFPFRSAEGKVSLLDERAIVEEYDHLRIHREMHAARLDELHAVITFLRKRVWYVAHYDVGTGQKLPKVAWSRFNRGWRWQMLLARSQGERVAR